MESRNHENGAKPKSQMSREILNSKSMKKFIVFLAVMSIGSFLKAQVNPHALGVRVYGNGSFNGAELSYQHGISEKNRMELDLSLGFGSNYNRLFLVGIYHWDWKIDGGLNWYIGPGASVSFDKYDNSDGYLNLGLGGQIGIEYDFNNNKIPILLSLDVRPMWDFLGDNSGFGWGTALGIRYTW